MPVTWVSSPPSPVPSPPLYAAAFEGVAERHYRFFRPAICLGHDLHVNDFSDPRNWRLRINAIALPGNGAQFSLRHFPTHMLPFFAYKDAAIYTPENGGSVSSSSLFNTIYREWYPTRDRSVFDDGIFDRSGAPFFAVKMRINCEEPVLQQPIPQLPVLLKHLIRWHIALSHHIQHILPQFTSLDEVTRELVRPGLSLAQSHHRTPVDYMPILRSTFTECFIWVDAGLEDSNVILVVLGEDMLRRILLEESEELTRDVDMEKQVKDKAALEAEDERRDRKLDEHGGFDDDASVEHVSIWRGSMVDVMRAALAGDEKRRRGLREYNPVLHEWLGEGVNVGK